MLFYFCLSQNFFVNNNKFYLVTNGLAMARLFAFFADLFMDKLENIYILPKFPEISPYFRYVEDCLAFITEDLLTYPILLM